VSDGWRIAKMSGAGNDFVLLGPDEARRLGDEAADWARRVCRRGLSVGADGLLLVEPAASGRVRVRFHNPDGSVTFCGNGSRCAARFARLRGLAGDTMVLETAIGDVPASISDDVVRIELPLPEDRGVVELECAGTRFEGRWIVAGVPHYVVFVDDPAAAPLEQWGPLLRRHPAFGADGVNLDLARIDDSGVTLRTYERGVERETLACGSGAVAAAFAAHLAGAPENLRVVPRSGIPLEVEMIAEASRPRAIRLTGDARLIFEGRLDAEAVSGFADP